MASINWLCWNICMAIHSHFYFYDQSLKIPPQVPSHCFPKTVIQQLLRTQKHCPCVIKHHWILQNFVWMDRCWHRCFILVPYLWVWFWTCYIYPLSRLYNNVSLLKYLETQPKAVLRVHHQEPNWLHTSAGWRPPSDRTTISKTYKPLICSRAPFMGTRIVPQNGIIDKPVAQWEPKTESYYISQLKIARYV